MREDTYVPWPRFIHADCPGCGGTVRSLEWDGWCHRCATGNVETFVPQLLIDPNQSPAVLQARREADEYFARLGPVGAESRARIVERKGQE